MEAAAGVVAEGDALIRLADHIIGVVMAEERARDIALPEPAIILAVVIIGWTGAFLDNALGLTLIHDVPFGRISSASAYRTHNAEWNLLEKAVNLRHRDMLE